MQLLPTACHKMYILITRQADTELATANTEPGIANTAPY